MPKLKDPIGGLTHCIGAVFAVVALFLLIQDSLDPFKPWHVVTFSIFCTGMFLLYTTTTLYHWLPVPPKTERILQKLDHMMIYVLIASTFTPVYLIPFRGVWGWSLIGIIWGLTAFGILFKIFQFNLPKWFSNYYLLSIHGMAGCYRHFTHDSDPPSGRLGLDYHWRIILYTRSDHL